MRAIDPDDQRRSLLALSNAGAEQVSIIAPQSEQCYARIEDAFGVDRLGRLLDKLQQLANLDLAQEHLAHTQEHKASS